MSQNHVYNRELALQFAVQLASLRAEHGGGDMPPDADGLVASATKLYAFLAPTPVTDPTPPLG
jgi:hypothetical protein